MLKTAEAVSLGHPDKTADFISSFILDKLIIQDTYVKYAVEVLIKNNIIVLGGEVSGNVDLSEINTWVKEALYEIGYTDKYHQVWKDFVIDPDHLQIINLIGQQSSDINYGVVQQKGWGDQGVFVGYATCGEQHINKELFLARKLNAALYNLAKSDVNLGLGLDIKTQITLNNCGNVETVIVAIPMIYEKNLVDFIKNTIDQPIDNIIVNGTGRYTYHGAIADCGITGRKLACDFYSTASPIGGGSPWTKDPSKADLSLNLYARKLAVESLQDNDECFIYLSSCIGRAQLPSAVIKTIKNDVIKTENIVIDKTPEQIIADLGLRNPVFAMLCKHSVGL